MSRTVIFYFTGTGNSMAVARKLARLLEDTEIVPLLKEDAEACIKTDTERIGLLYPIYMNAVPRVVAQFIRRLKPLTGCYYFGVATHGGRPGMSGLNLERHLSVQNIQLDAYFEVDMINNTPKGVAPKKWMTLDWEKDITPEKVGEKLRQADMVIPEIARSILGKEKRLPAAPSSKLNHMIMKLLWSISERSRTRLDFTVDEACIGCGLCESICTTNRISMKAGKPQWIKDECNYCYACFNYCPAQAIVVKHYTKRLGRYHHPDIMAEDIIKQK